MPRDCQLAFVLCVATTVFGGSSAANAQEAGPAPPRTPKSDPILSDPTIEDILLENQRARETEEAVAPTPPRPAQRAVPSVDAPDLPGADFAVPGRRVYREGTFFASRRGDVHSAAGQAVFVPEQAPGPGLPDEPPMVLMPSQKLAQMLAVFPDVDGAPVRVPVILSGQIFVYRGRHYLLPTAFALSQPERSADESSPDTPPPAAAERDPRVDDLIRSLEADRGARAIDPVRVGPVSESVTAGARGLLTEGTILAGRRGRLVRQASAGGRFAFSTDNDSDSPGPAPMLIAPCRLLEQIEALAALRGENLAVSMTGRVLEHGGRNYLLPTIYRVVPPSDLTPMQ